MDQVEEIKRAVEGELFKLARLTMNRSQTIVEDVFETRDAILEICNVKENRGELQ
jgi:hypothetical protein